MESIVVAVAFGVFLILAIKPIKNMLVGMLDQYSKDAVKQLTEANEMFQEASKMYDDIKKQHKQAEKEAQEIITKAKEEALALVEEAKKELERVTQKKTELTMGRIEQQEKQIVEDLKNEAINLAISKVQESLINQLDAEAQMALINEGIKEVKKLVH